MRHIRWHYVAAEDALYLRADDMVAWLNDMSAAAARQDLDGVAETLTRSAGRLDRFKTTVLIDIREFGRAPETQENP